MITITCPQIYIPQTLEEQKNTLFLGGGITGCKLWQSTVELGLKNTNYILLNPRRAIFNIEDKSISEEQIKWEYYHLKIAKQRMFYFPKESICPIALFELGKYIDINDDLYVAYDEEYQRKDDLIFQMKEARQKNLFNSLQKLIEFLKIKDLVQ